jgi:hypothetical protein
MRSILVPADEQSHAFVVRIWEERRDIPGAPAIWRGFVCDARGGARVYFNTLAALCAYLAQQTGIALSGAGNEIDESRGPLQ